MSHLFEAYAGVKGLIVAAVGWPESLLHVHVGLAIYLLIATLRQKLASRFACAALLALEGLNETLDTLSGYQRGLAEPLGDLLSTMFWPALLFGLGRSAWLCRNRGDPVIENARSRTTATGS